MHEAMFSWGIGTMWRRYLKSRVCAGAVVRCVARSHFVRCYAIFTGYACGLPNAVAATGCRPNGTAPHSAQTGLTLVTASRCTCSPSTVQPAVYVGPSAPCAPMRCSAVCAAPLHRFEVNVGSDHYVGMRCFLYAHATEPGASHTGVLPPFPSKIATSPP